MKQIKMSGKHGKGKVLLLDDEDFVKYGHMKWHVGTHGYVVHSVANKNTGKKENIRIARLIMNCPKDMVVDHINHNKLDNTKKNLRIVTKLVNWRNRIDGKSGVVGVSQYTRYPFKWRAHVGIMGKYHDLGCYDTIEEAKIARDTYLEYEEALISYLGIFAHGYMGIVL